jgi:hypothetical protein
VNPVSTIDRSELHRRIDRLSPEQAAALRAYLARIEAQPELTSVVELPAEPDSGPVFRGTHVPIRTLFDSVRARGGLDAFAQDHAEVDRAAADALLRLAPLCVGVAVAAWPGTSDGSARFDLAAAPAAPRTEADSAGHPDPGPPAERSALDYLGDYVGSLPGLVGALLGGDPQPDGDPFGDALVDDYRRQVAGLGKRAWRALDAAGKAAAVAAKTGPAEEAPAGW